MIFGSHVEFGSHFDYSLQSWLSYSQKTTSFFSEIVFYFISIGLHGKFQMAIFMLFHGMLMKGFSNVLNELNRDSYEFPHF